MPDDKNETFGRLTVDHPTAHTTDLPTTTAPPLGDSAHRWRLAARWMVTFAGFPLGGLAALLVVGPVDSAGAAVVGGAITGVVLGAVQAIGLGRLLPSPVVWTLATGAGLALGLGVGAAAVGYATDLGSLAIQGAVSGFAVGLAQATVLSRRLGRVAAGWPFVLAAAWALGWTVITAAGVQVDQQFTIFGALGAATVTALTLVLPLTLARRPVGSRS